ncbi:MAG: nucleotide-binding protein [Mycobacteriales bacterium]
MKVGVVGKGGVGKTSVTALLAQRLASRGLRVIAVDTDSNPNLGLSLGLSLDEVAGMPPLPQRLVLGAANGAAAELGSVLATYARPTPAGVSLLAALRISDAGGGCTCGGHASVRSLLGETLAEHADVTIVDMEAGLEHLSRSGGTLAHADVLLVVMEPNRKSVWTAARTRVLAEQLGLTHVYGLGNKARDHGDVEFFERACAEDDVPLAGVLPYEESVLSADRAGRRVGPATGSLATALDSVLGVALGSLTG